MLVSVTLFLGGLLGLTVSELLTGTDANANLAAVVRCGVIPALTVIVFYQQTQLCVLFKLIYNRRDDKLSFFGGGVVLRTVW